MPRPPNILWIITTQWRAQALGSAGDPNLLSPGASAGTRASFAHFAPSAPANSRTPFAPGAHACSRTPHIDALARDPHTLNFAQAVTPHPFGPFARAAMLTGAPSPENGVRDYYDPLPPSARTIAHELRERHGYATAFFGKWHLAKRDPLAPLVGDAHARAIVPPEARGGFDFWEGFESGFLLNDPWLHGTRLPEPRQFHGYQSDILCTRAAEYLREKTTAATDAAAIAATATAAAATTAAAANVVAAAAAPQFCIVSLEAPHPPYAAPAPIPTGRAVSPKPPPPRTSPDNRSSSGGFGVSSEAPGSTTALPAEINAITLRANVPLGGEIEAQARRELAGYYAHIEATDAAIGRLIAAVRTHAPDTLIVFTSVHGDMHGSHGLFRKGWPYEESVRVPLLLNSPALKAEIAQDAVSLLDLPAMTIAFATAFVAQSASLQRRGSILLPCLGVGSSRSSMSAARLPERATRATTPWDCIAQAASLHFGQAGWQPALRKTHAHISMPSVVRLPRQCDRVWRGVRTPARKLILNADGTPWLFFDLEADPLELRNLADNPQRKQEMEKVAQTLLSVP